MSITETNCAIQWIVIYIIQWIALSIFWTTGARLTPTRKIVLEPPQFIILDTIPRRFLKDKLVIYTVKGFSKVDKHRCRNTTFVNAFPSLTFRWCGAGENGERAKLRARFLFALAAYDLTCSPLSKCLEQAMPFLKRSVKYETASWVEWFFVNQRTGNEIADRNYLNGLWNVGEAVSARLF